MNVFLRTWARSDYWAMSVLRPGALPTDVDRERYFSSVVGLEQAGMHAEAISAWRAALAAWPDSPIALFGLGNAYLSLDKFAEAEKVYRELLAAQPALNVARNNLAMALAGQARYAEAIAEINEAMASEPDAILIEELRDTLAEVQQMAADAENIAR
jgi:tetratricopeptide (TPR) repeat protein